MGKKINVVGAGLYGCLTAIAIKKSNPAFFVNLIESSKKVLPNFDSITIANINLNNGFHGIELPRAQMLFDILNKEVKIVTEIGFNNKAIFVKGNLIPYTNSFKTWPEAIKGYFNIIPPVNLNEVSISDLLSKDFLKYLETIATRYSKNFEDVKGLLIPWFLPADCVINSNDEGDVFRNKVRSGSVNSKYGSPRGGLFSALQKPMHNYMQELGINIQFGIKIQFEKDGFKFYNVDDDTEKMYEDIDESFYCASAVPIIKAIDSELFKELIKTKRFLYNAVFEYNPSELVLNNEFSEILCADENAPYISRISFPDKKNLIQVECFVRTDEDISLIKKEIKTRIHNILKIDLNKKLKLLGMEQTRVVYFPNQSKKSLAADTLNSWVKSSKINLHFRPFFGPVNMAKTAIWANENIQLIK